MSSDSVLFERTVTLRVTYELHLVVVRTLIQLYLYDMNPPLSVFSLVKSVKIKSLVSSTCVRWVGGLPVPNISVPPTVSTYSKPKIVIFCSYLKLLRLGK